jgi:hypothetical protein
VVVLLIVCRHAQLIFRSAVGQYFPTFSENTGFLPRALRMHHADVSQPKSMIFFGRGV